MVNGRKETAKVTTVEDGLVITDEKADALEARVMATFRKPFIFVFSLIVLIFIILLGGSLFLTSMSNTVDKMQTTVTKMKITVDNTDDIVTTVAGPKARAASAKQMQAIIDQLIQGENCNQQNNLQRAFDQLGNSIPALVNVDVIKPPCKRE